jgi:hypothetical protein
MANPPPDPDFTSTAGVESGHESAPGMPRWVQVFGIIVLVLVLLFVVQHLTGTMPSGHTR